MPKSVSFYKRRYRPTNTVVFTVSATAITAVYFFLPLPSVKRTLIYHFALFLLLFVFVCMRATYVYRFEWNPLIAALLHSDRR